MSSTTDESESPRSGCRRLRIALIGCFAAFCLAVFYVLLSAPLLLYAVHHPGSSSAQMVDTCMRPLLWLDDLLTPDLKSRDAEYREPLHAKVLNLYYGLWGSDVEGKFKRLQFVNWLNSDEAENLLKSLEESSPRH